MPGPILDEEVHRVLVKRITSALRVAIWEPGRITAQGGFDAPEKVAREILRPWQPGPEEGRQTKGD